MQASSVVKIILSAIFIMGVPGFAFAEKQEKQIDLNPRDNRSYAEREQQRGMSEAQRGYEHTQREQQQEKMRDKTHDGRVKIDGNTSVGVDNNPPSINIRKGTQ
jgi:hypothetical protein